MQRKPNTTESKTIHNINKINPDIKRKTLFEKIIQSLKMKFKKVISERCYAMSDLNRDIEIIFPHSIDNFHFPHFMLKAEKLLLEKLAKSELVQQNKKLPDLGKINALMELKHNEKMSQQPENKVKSLCEREKEKRKDEWAILAQEDTKKFKDEKKQLINTAAEQKRVIRDDLAKQIKKKSENGPLKKCQSSE